MKAGLSQFLAQLLGLALAVAISVAISHSLGASDQADAFLLGRRLVTGLQELLAQVLTLVFLPMVAMQADRRALWRLTGWVALAGVGVAVAFAVLSGPIVATIAPEMTGEAAQLAARVIAVLSASLPLALLGVLAGAALNLRGSFGWPALVRLMPRLMVLAVFLLALDAAKAVSWAAMAFVLGNGIALALMVPFVRAVPARGSTARAHVAAALLLVAGGQAALWIETALAARAGVGGVTLLEMAQRVAALLGNTLALALVMPVFAKWTADPAARTVRALSSVVTAGLALLILTQGALALFAPRIVADVLGQGAFGPEDQAALLPVLWVMVLPPFATLLARVMVIWLLTRPMAAGARWISVSVAADLVVRSGLGLWLVPQIGVSAVALGMVLGPMASACVLGAVCWSDVRAARIGAGPVIAAGLGLGAIAVAAWGLSLVWQNTGALGSLAGMAAAGLVGLAVFLAVLRARNQLSIFRF
ncbi:hypothetical protein HJ526_04470 [Donghicola sp. C2-DW-16]|uniref:Uncharacterized protein n=1 Tax=Donghicola mangrovi TaxID=2729614 RepID=A0ABX2PB24_9RHOB|nr:lipid II flippase MurJ [Donghicola mangrovi]NVO26666.1 hypothetical protein [Donghicola mangrovi]